MIEKEYIFRFLRDLRNNNGKEWMDENRDWYHTAKDRWISEVEEILKGLAKHDDRFQAIEPKSTLSRINNNRRFHPDKPVYKDFFTCDPSPGDDQGFSVMHISVGQGNSFIGAGMYHPPSDALKKFHQAVYYNGDKLKEILRDKGLKEFFGDLSSYDNDLKTAQ